MIETLDATLARVLDGTRCLLIDFDGPVCAVFGGHPTAHVVAQRLEALLPTSSGKAAADPFEVLRAAAQLNERIAARVNADLTRAEREAVRTAPQTEHAADVVDAAHTSGRSVAIVSNNAQVAVEDFLSVRRLDVDLVVGRTSHDASLLKPNPHLILVALRALGVDAQASVMIGDSATDIAASRRAGVRAIGYANKPHKPGLLHDAGADVVLDALAPLAAALR